MNRTDRIEWFLVPAAVLLLALLHRTELRATGVVSGLFYVREQPEPRLAAA